MTVEETNGSPLRPSITRSLLPSGKPGPTTPGETARVVFWGLFFYAGVELMGAFLAKNPLGAAAVQAALAEWGAGRLGINWSDVRGPRQKWQRIAGRAARGAALGLAAAALVLGFALATGAATLAPNAPLAGQLVVGLIVALLVAVRDELLLRGVVVRAVAGAPTLAVLGACAAAGAAARLGTLGVPGDAGGAPAVAAAALEGVAFGVLWLRDRGAWMAWGAHAMWVWATGSLLRGGLLDVRVAMNRWGGGDAGLEGGLSTLAILAVVAAAAIGYYYRANAPRAGA